MRWLLCIVVGAVSQAAWGAPPHIELTVDGQPRAGRQFAHDQEVCWLLDREGRLSEVSLGGVTAFRALDGEFAPLTIVEMRNKLRAEVPKEYEVMARGPYVVCAPRGRGAAYAEVLDHVHRGFVGQLRRRKFEIQELDFPLVAFVTPSQDEFFERCRQDGVPISDSIRGYYSVESNWITFYDRPEEEGEAAVLRPGAAQGLANLTGAGNPFDLSGSRRALSISGPVRQTTVHEAVHQLAFNLGLHARLAKNPKWIVEGLAMRFETTLAPADGRTAGEDINLERLQMFADYRNSRRPAGSLVDVIASDRLFADSALDAYGEAWALTYFLCETRSSKYHEYLKRLIGRDPLGATSDADRLADFQAVFGDDVAWLEVEYLRMMDRLIDEQFPNSAKGGRAKSTARRGGKTNALTPAPVDPPSDEPQDEPTGRAAAKPPAARPKGSPPPGRPTRASGEDVPAI